MGHRSEPTIIILLIGQSTKMLTKSVSLPLDYVQLSDLIREVSLCSEYWLKQKQLVKVQRVRICEVLNEKRDSSIIPSFPRVRDQYKRGHRKIVRAGD